MCNLPWPPVATPLAPLCAENLAAEGRPVSFTIVTTPGDLTQRAVYMQTQLSRFDNLDVAVETLDTATFGATLLSGNFDMASYTFVGIGPARSARASVRGRNSRARCASS